MLDAYLRELAKVQGSMPAAAMPVAAAPGGTRRPLRWPRHPVSAAAPAPAVAAPTIPSSPTAANLATSPAETKQRGRWLLHEGREQLLKGNYDAAQQKADEARALDVHWGLFDDTPEKLEQEIIKARPKYTPAVGGAEANLPHDRRTAKLKLREARTLLDNQQYEQAEALALEVKKWGLSYSFLEDNSRQGGRRRPGAPAPARRSGTLPAREQPSQGVYDELVRTSRELMKAASSTRPRQGPAGPGDGRLPRPESGSGRERPARHRDGAGRTRGCQAPPAPRRRPGSRAGRGARGADGRAACLRLPAAASPRPTRPCGRAAARPPDDAGPELTSGGTRRQRRQTPGRRRHRASPRPSPAEATGTRCPPPPRPARRPRPPPANRGEQLLAEAKALYASGNYPGGPRDGRPGQGRPGSASRPRPTS